MISIYKNELNKKEVKRIKTIEDNSWINLVNPTPDEIEELRSYIEIDKSIINQVLVERELPRVKKIKNGILVVIDVPFVDEKKELYKTYPLGIIICNDSHILTVSIKKFDFLEEFYNNKVEEFYTYKKSRFLIQMLLRTAKLYIDTLGYVDTDLKKKETSLSRATSNNQLIDLLGIQKMLVYFTNSLQANKAVLERLYKEKVITTYEEDLEILEDAIIETKQSLDMCSTYREILSTTISTYGTIISNNLNVAMKFLAGITIVFSIPTMIASFLGMNVSLGSLADNEYSFIIICGIALVISLIIAYWLKKKDML